MPANYNYYNPYFPVSTYQSGQYFVPQSPTFQTTWLQPSVQQSMPQNNQGQFTNIWFNGNENDARMYPVAPNNAVALWSEMEPVIYLKKADASGKPEFKILDLVERKQETVENKIINYASKDDMSSLVDIVKSLGETVGSLKADIESMKDDVYGLAGKKPATKKVEVKDE